MMVSPRRLFVYVRSDALGDGLMRIPALRAARGAFPDAHITYASAGHTSLATALRRQVAGVVDEFVKAPSPIRLVRSLDAAPHEIAVADLRTVAGWLVVARAGMPRGVTYEANFPAYALSWSRGFGFRPEHNAWRYHRVIERLAGRALPFDHRITVLDAAREEAARIRGHGERPFVLIGANSARHKALTAQQVATVARELLRRDTDVVFLQTPGEGPTGAQVADLVPGVSVVGPEPELNGVPLLEVILALGARARAYVGPEGGLGHCMAGLLTPVVILNHGAGMPRWRPLSGLVEVVDAQAVSPTGRSADAPPAAIVAALDRLLAAADRGEPRLPFEAWASTGSSS